MQFIYSRAIGLYSQTIYAHARRSSINRAMHGMQLLRLLYSTSVNRKSGIGKLIEAIRNESELNEDVKFLFKKYWKLMDQNQDSVSILEHISVSEFMGFIAKTFPTSVTSRSAFYRELIFQGNKDMKLVNYMISTHSKSKGSTIVTPLELLHFCVTKAIEHKHIVLAVDLYILHYKLYSNEDLDLIYSSKLISALSFTNPRYDYLYLLKFINLDNLFLERNEILPMTQFQTSAICLKALSLDKSHALFKASLTKILDTSYTNTKNLLRSDQIVLAYHLIDKDYSLNNASGLYYTWLKIKDHYVSMAFHDPRIVYKALKIAANNKAYRSMGADIIQNLSPQYYSNNPLILPAMIDFATKTKNLRMIQTIMNDVNNNILPNNFSLILQSRRCLSSLLRMHLKFNDSDGVDNVLQQLMDIYGSVSKENYQAIVSHLIKSKKQENFQKAVKLVNNLPFNQASLSYTEIIGGLINMQKESKLKNLNKNYMSLIDKLLDNAHEFDLHHKDSLWNIVASLYIKHIVQWQGSKDGSSFYNKSDINETNYLDLAKLIYMNSIVIEKKSWDHITFNPFAFSTPSKIRLKITPSNKSVILRNIALSSVLNSRRDIFIWCCSELYSNGYSSKELILDWNMMLKKHIRKADFQSKREIEETLSLEGIPFIEQSLQ